MNGCLQRKHTRSSGFSSGPFTNDIEYAGRAKPHIDHVFPLKRLYHSDDVMATQPAKKVGGEAEVQVFAASAPAVHSVGFQIHDRRAEIRAFGFL